MAALFSLATATAVVLNGGRAVAQEVCPSCRAMIHYHSNCSENDIDNPPNRSSIGFTGNVVELRRVTCGLQMRIKVTRSSGSALPSQIGINLFPCLYPLSVGDAITDVVLATPRPDGTYSLVGCRAK
jgi:hypothetical protein